MRLVSYNILDGGEGRADPLAETLLAQRPDIVTLIEADCPPVIERISHRLSMDFVIAEGLRHKVAILSRWPIVESINHARLREGLTNCLFEAMIRDPSDHDWIVGAVHLHPHANDADDQTRQQEVEIILEAFKDHRAAGRPHLLAGDFNADSPVQAIDITRCKPSTQKAWHSNGGNLPRSAITALLADGYLDTLHTLHPDQAAKTGSFSTQFPGQRVDYCFSFGLSSRPKSAWIEHDRLAQFASDHFPIGVEFD